MINWTLIYHELSPGSILQIMLLLPYVLYVFLEKTKLKDDSSNDADWVCDLRIILIAAQKNYVLEAPLGARPAAGATPDIMNVWQARYDDYLIV